MAWPTRPGGPCRARRATRVARDLVEKVIAAKGGLAKLKAVRSVVADAETTFRMEQGPLASTSRTYVAYPDKFRVDAKVAGADVVQVYNAGFAWLSDPSGVHDAPALMRSGFAASVKRDTIPLLVAASEGGVTARSLPDEGREGRTYRVLELSGESLASSVRLYVDSAGMIARQSYSEPGPAGRLLQVEEVFSDYRTVDGLQVPFRAELRHNGRPILERVLSTVTINGTVDLKLFEKPQR
jgi:hypothetical protein